MTSGVVARVDVRGVRVRLARGVYGTCPAAQLLDVQLSRPHERFASGQSVRCVVTESEPQREKLLLSLKPTLVGSNLPRIARYTELTQPLTRAVAQPCHQPLDQPHNQP